VAHAGLPAEAERLKVALLKKVPGGTGVYVTEIGAAASAHGGPGTLAVAVQEYVLPVNSGTVD
jgi:hypothetical protein